MDDCVTGTFEPNGKGGGHLRSASTNYRVRPDDIVLASTVCRAMKLRGGEVIALRVGGEAKRRRGCITELDEIESVNGCSIDQHLEACPFEDLTPISPTQPLRFETPDGPLSMRVVDLMTPIGLGQRGLIVAAPRTGKTVLLQQMAEGVAANHPDVYLMVVLVDERPEEVTDIRRSVRGEVVASCSDHDVADHIRLARLAIEKAKRMVEAGRDVLVLLDSLTRLARAFNANIQGSRRIMSGGLDTRALIEPKAVFGAARNVEDGGSLTIIASCLVETGSRMDEVIFNEFQGTGNMEITLTRQLANKRIWPAIDLPRSGTRKEELLLSPEALRVSGSLRRSLADVDPERAITTLLENMQKYPDNAAFIKEAERSVRR